MAKRKRAKNLCPLTTSAAKRRAADKLTATIKDSLPPGLAHPALRALAGASYTNLDQLARDKEEALLELHGIGPNAIRLIRAALARRGQSFAT